MMTYARAASPLGALLLLAWPLAAQDPKPIQDNSFLLEEAYNQERGVVQHVSTFERPDVGGLWGYSFTQEWPLGGIRHQLSYSVPVLHADGFGTGVGDVLLSYRYQAVGNPDARTLFAPRASVAIPTGNEAKGRGTGELGVEVNLPLSYTLAPQVITHWNAGLMAVRNLPTNYSLGASAIWLARPSLNVVLEGIWLTEGSAEAAFLNPGLRYAINFDSGLQIVPGIAYTIGVGPSKGEDGLFLYLSFEHAFTRQ